MNSKDVLTVNVNLDWRTLVVLGIIGLVLAFSYSVAGAQDGEPPRINDVEIEPTVEPPGAGPVTVPDSPEAQSGDMLYTLNAEWVPRDTVGPTPSSPVGAADISAQAASGRRFYLADSWYATDQVLAACASGYHTASLWEILDVSNLSYAYDHPDAHFREDSGNGPPSGYYGWVRTGYENDSSSTTGMGNCDTWTSTSSENFGVAIQLSTTWETAPGDIGAWDATSFTCDHVGEVWCVED